MNAHSSSHTPGEVGFASFHAWSLRNVLPKVHNTTWPVCTGRTSSFDGVMPKIDPLG
jgi:hypothetical protein